MVNNTTISANRVRSRTRSYKVLLESTFKGLFSFALDEDYLGPRHKHEHKCNVCGNTFDIRCELLFEHERCPICHSEVRHFAALLEHVVVLRKYHPTLSLACPPLKFTLRKLVCYKCNVCNSLQYEYPHRVEKNSYSCSECSRLRIFGRNSIHYGTRLRLLFSNTVMCVQRFHQTRPLRHACTKDSEHTWTATAAKTLQGYGCPYCRVSAQVKRLQTLTYRNRDLVISSMLERYALPIVAAEARTARSLKLRLEHPIPVLFGKHVPPFYVKNTNTLYDVIPAAKYERYKKLIRKCYEAAKAKGFNYGLILIAKKEDGTRKAILLSSADWISEQTQPVPKDWGRDDYNIGKENRRMKCLEDE